VGQSGCDLLRQQLADRGTWLALDPPGLAGRNSWVGGRDGDGRVRCGTVRPVRDHLLGVTFRQSGDGVWCRARTRDEKCRGYEAYQRWRRRVRAFG